MEPDDQQIELEVPARHADGLDRLGQLLFVQARRRQVRRPSDGSGGGNALDVCGILDDAAVERALGEPVAAPGSEENVPGGSPLCSYVGEACPT